MERSARVLVVEDEGLIAMEIEAVLEDLGCEIIGPVGRLDAALKAATDMECDGAILDVNLNGQRVFPVAERLRDRGIPFILSTGYQDSELPHWLQNRPRIRKPFDAAALRRLATQTFMSGR